MTVRFTSDSEDESTGFQLMYEAMDVSQVPECIPSGSDIFKFPNDDLFTSIADCISQVLKK